MAIHREEEPESVHLAWRGLSTKTERMWGCPVSTLLLWQCQSKQPTHHQHRRYTKMFGIRTGGVQQLHCWPETLLPRHADCEWLGIRYWCVCSSCSTQQWDVNRRCVGTWIGHHLPLDASTGGSRHGASARRIVDRIHYPHDTWEGEFCASQPHCGRHMRCMYCCGECWAWGLLDYCWVGNGI